MRHPLTHHPPMHYAHMLPDRGPDAWEPLEEHLRLVEELAANWLRPFCWSARRCRVGQNAWPLA
ncbi:hypothetical protein Pla175_19580 [Pirellulimonas nuda]|uniref:Uncharacterized protein n=1 Tax=Pirellulimonas nuda TaxID=2528009 RepID=A0A518DAS0_9BACT|nr:hypothetical protein Pla175_19580 [Pirellulimonas nuda]